MDNYQPNRACCCQRCLARGLMGPVVLVTLGVLFLLSEFDVARFHRTWPILLIIIGAVKVLGGSADARGHVDHIVQTPGPVPPPPAAPGAAEGERPGQVQNV